MTEPETVDVRAKVFVVSPEFHLAKACTFDDECHLTITRHTKGVSLDDVREVQVYLLTVTRRLPRVLYTRLVDPGDRVDKSPKQS